MSLELGNLKPRRGAKKKPKRVGRGRSSGHGKTSCRGQKGQKCRSGASQMPGFEGGQMPLVRRIPKGGFRHQKRWEIGTVNLDDLNRFDKGSVVEPQKLIDAGLVRKRVDKVKILGGGELTRSLTVKAHLFSQSAIQKIKAVGGSVETLPFRRSSKTDSVPVPEENSPSE